MSMRSWPSTFWWVTVHVSVTPSSASAPGGPTRSVQGGLIQLSGL